MVAELIREFHAGHFAKVVAQFDFPLAMHLEGRLVLLARPADMERYLAALNAALQAAEFADVLPCVTAVELPRRGRFRAWVQYTHLDATGQVVALSERTFFCRDMGDHIRVEMLEITRLPVASLCQWSPPERMIA